MNDRYLYRAKRKDNGEWVIGLPGYDIDGNITEIEVYRGHEDCVTYEVDPSTFCQCVGIKDKNGKLRWEKDIARRKIFDREVIGIVKWLDIGFTGFRHVMMRLSETFSTTRNCWRRSDGRNQKKKAE